MVLDIDFGEQTKIFKLNIQVLSFHVGFLGFRGRGIRFERPGVPKTILASFGKVQHFPETGQHSHPFSDQLGLHRLRLQASVPPRSAGAGIPRLEASIPQRWRGVSKLWKLRTKNNFGQFREGPTLSPRTIPMELPKANTALTF